WERKGRENASSQCSSTRCFNTEVTHDILQGKAQMTVNKRVPVSKTNTGGWKSLEISRKVFSANFVQLSIIFLWLSDIFSTALVFPIMKHG
ncbi:hypothetical protein RJ641_028690, partial [Dillenia turbinata]